MTTLGPEKRKRFVKPEKPPIPERREQPQPEQEPKKVPQEEPVPQHA
jgi:hypothetical protein